MSNLEEHDYFSSSPDDDRPSESEEFDKSSSTSLNITTSQAAFELHRFNTLLLRKQQEMEMKHDEDILALRRRIVELERENCHLINQRQLFIEQNETASRINVELNEYRTNLQQAHDKLLAELSDFKELLRQLQEENKGKEIQLKELKNQLDKAVQDVTKLNEEHAALYRENDVKINEISDLKRDLAEKDQQIMDLQIERDADNARMQSVKDVQIAFETVRKDAQEKECQVQQLEEVLGQTIHEKEVLTSRILKLEEEALKKAEHIEHLRNEFASTQIVQTQQNDHMESGLDLNGSDQPIDNVISTEENNFCQVSNGNCPIDFAFTHETPKNNNENANCSINTQDDDLLRYKFVISAESASCTIEALRCEYEIERARNNRLQQEIDRILSEREHLKTEVYGEMQNGSLSSLTCVLMAKNREREGRDESQMTSWIRFLSKKLLSMIEEKDAAEAKLGQFRDDIDTLLSKNHDLNIRLEKHENETGQLWKNLSKMQLEYALATNRVKSLVYQKEYLKREILNTQRIHQWSLSRDNSRNKRNLFTTHSYSSLLPSSRKRFKVIVLTIIAVNRLERMNAKTKKVRSKLFS